MRRDIGFYFEAEVPAVYNAYLSAAGNEKFRRECREEPYHTLTFGLNFSVMYNFNGGSCVVRFIPYNNGTAVNMRFILAQGVGARYEKYAGELTNAAALLLNKLPVQMSLDVNLFLNEENRVYPATAAEVPAEEAPAAPVAAPAAEVTSNRFCTNCGAALRDGALFCSMCGTKIVTEKRCKNCGFVGKENDLFCCQCGTKF